MELEAPDHEDAPDPKGHSSGVPQKLLRSVVVVLLGLVVTSVVISMLGGDEKKDLVANQAELEKAIAQVVDGTGLGKPRLAGLLDSCIPTTTRCGDVLGASFDVGSVDEVCAVVDTIAANHEVTEHDSDKCRVIGTVDGHSFLAQLGPATAGTKGFPLLVTVL